MRSNPLRRCSGGMEGRPTLAYMAVKVGESAVRARSTIGLMARIGWSAGTRASGVTAESMIACWAASPRIVHLQEYFLTCTLAFLLVHPWGLFQHPANPWIRAGEGWR